MRSIKIYAARVIVLSLLVTFLAPSSANAAPNVLTVVASASAAANQLVNSGSGITIVASSESTFGRVESFDSIDLGTISGNTYALNTPGILLTSSTGRGADSGTPSQALRTQMTNLWAATPGASTEPVRNVSSVSFDFITNSPSTISIALDFLFLSNENLPGPWDLGMVIVDGVNYAFLPGNKILRVSPDSNLNDLRLSSVFFATNWVNSAASTQSLVALLDMSRATHSITVAVADTGDNSVQSMLAISSINASTVSTGGVATLSSTAPDAPTVGTATATGTTTANVSFTAPASDGGSTILSYTATSNPGNITSTVTQAGSGTISMTGLSPATSYTFTVTALNAIGSSVASSASNSITTLSLGVAPLFSSPSSYDYRFTVQITDYDPAFTYTVTASTGTVSVSSTGLITVTDLRPDQTVTVTVTTTRAGYASLTGSITGRSQVAPMIPTNKPTVTISDTLITCTIGSYSATPTSTAFSLFVDGKHISTNFSALGDYLPDWIIPWATSSTITRTATLTSASWAISEAYKGKAITCSTLAYSKNAIGLTASAPLTAR